MNFCILGAGAWGTAVAVYLSAPNAAAVRPFPKDETTPPVIKMYFMMLFPSSS